jgi:hypothetical protein
MAVDVTSELVGHWSFNEGAGSTTADLAGGDDPGTLVGSPTWTTSGKTRSDLVFNGTTASVSVADSTDLHVGMSKLTVAAWIKTTATNGTIISKGSLSGDHFALQVSGGKARFQFNPGGGPFGVSSTTNVNDGNWHLIVGVRTDLQSCEIYVDGILSGTLNSSGAFTSLDTTSALLIGTAGAGTYFNGYIDNVRYYTRDLGAADISALFISGSNPVTVADSYGVLSQSTNVSANLGVLANDLPRDETPITATLLTNATHGNVTLNNDGSFVYVPQNGFSGTDSFTYRVSDGVVDPVGATVSLQVTSLADWSTIGTRVRNTAMAGASSISAATVNNNISLMNLDGSFTDLTYASNSATGASALNTHASRLTTLAKAYQSVGGPKFHDATLLQRIIAGYTYLANTAPNSLALPNWFDTKIGVPNNLWPGLVAMGSDLSSTLTNDVLTKYFDLATVWELTDLSGKNGGANLTERLEATIAESVLRNDTTLIPAIVELVTRDLSTGGYSASGLQPDNSFSQHTSYPAGATYQGGTASGNTVQMHSGSYGVVYADGLADMIPWLHGTSLAFDSATEAKAIGYVLDGQEWLFRNKAIEPTVNGRALTRKGQTINAARSGTSSASTRLQALGIRTTELQSLVSRLASGSTTTNYLDGNKSFYTTDMMVQQEQGFMASVRMISQRTQRPETLQIPGGTAADGAKHFFLADGVTTLFQDGTEYGTTSGQEIFPVWNWARLPGTTLEQLTDAELIAMSAANAGSSGGTGNVGTGTFVGSVSNGANGAAAMDYGRTLGSVTAKKSYFYFDEGYVALGAGINAATATKSVNTTLNQTLQNGTVTVKASDGSVQSFGTGGSQTLTNPKWLLHGGVGYALLGNNGTVTVQAQSQTGTWESIGTATGSVTQNVFSAWVDHGLAPVNASYAYAVLPGMNATTLDSYLAASHLSVLSNTASLQAVRNNSSGLTQIAFYQPGSITIANGLTITVDKACMVQVKELAGKNIELSVSDPTQSQTQVKVSITRRLSGANVVWQRLVGTSEITINLPSGVNNIYAGQSVTRTLNFVEGPTARIFYNNSTSSTFGNGSGNPVNAIDPTKAALRPGETASVANYTNYSRGLNGLVFDVNSPGNLAGITAASFQFASWNSFPDSTPNFLNINPTVTVSTFAGGGLNGSDRVKVEFANNAIQNTWLRVTVLANANTGFATNEVFYFGNARFDVTPTSPFPSQQVTVNAFDVNAIRARQGQNPGVISNIYDVDRSGVVNAFDTNAVRAGQGVSSLRSFTAPSSLPMGLASSRSNSTSSNVDSLFADTSWLDAFQIGNNKNRHQRRG